jgi:hypothetical protein
MSLLHSDDLEPGQYVWHEYTIRVLIPRGKSRDKAVHEDVTSQSSVGAAGTCADCGCVTIETKGYPWGQDRYGNVRHPERTTYCPHCDGAEDVG